MGLRYKPDIVLHSLFVGNDLLDCPGTLVNCAGIILRMRGGLSAFRPRNLVFVTWIRSRIVLQREIWRQNEELKRDVYFGALSRIGFLNSLKNESEVYLIDSNPISWEDNYEILEAIQRRVSQSGAVYMIVLHPSPVQYHEELWSDFVAHFDLDPDDFDLKLPQTQLQYFFASRGVPCLNLLPLFETHRFPHRIYQKHDIHYKSLGNRRTARAIHEFLQHQNIIEEK